MITKILQSTVFLIPIMYIAGCQSYYKPSVQKYFVQKMEESDFMVLDFPLVSFEDYFDQPSQKELDVVKTIKKLNILLYLPGKQELGKTNKESQIVNQILKSQDYESLMSIHNNSFHVGLMVDRSDNKINEALIQFHQEDVVFGLVRVLGKNIEPEKILPLFAQLNTTNFQDLMGNSIGDDDQNVISNLLNTIKEHRDQKI